MKKIEKIMTPELFDSFRDDRRMVCAIAYAVRCCDSRGTFKHWGTCTYPVAYIVSDEQRAEAWRLYAENKAAELSGMKRGEFVMVAMGGEAPTGVGNHRARCRFMNDAGERFFLELSLSFTGQDYRVDYSIDIALDEKYDRECEEVFEHNRNVMRWSERMSMPSQYQYNARGCLGQTVGGTTWDDVLRFVNEKYGCSYTSGRLTQWCGLSPDDYINVC